VLGTLVLLIAGFQGLRGNHRLRRRLHLRHFSHAANQPARSIFLAIGLFLHFLSAIIALDRRLVNSGSIFIVNLFLGWTLICSVGTLAWALSGTSLTKPAPN
jgi:hypothetical protein